MLLPAPLLFILLSALFSSSETAFVGSSSYKIRKDDQTWDQFHPPRTQVWEGV